MEAFLGPYGPLNGTVLHISGIRQLSSPGRREGDYLRVLFELWVSGQMKLRRIKGYGP